MLSFALAAAEAAQPSLLLGQQQGLYSLKPVSLPSPKHNNLYSAGASCTPNATHGCLDTTPYAFATEFPCGSHGVFKLSEQSCCEQGRPFDFAAEYCCTGSGQNGVHSYNDGKCDLATPDGCQCYDAAEKMTQPLTSAADALIDTSSPPEGGYLCTGPTSSESGFLGCLNGYPYDYSAHAPCGHWLMQFGEYGCCPSPVGFLPYPFGSSYCCKIEGAEPGKDYAIKTDPCDCHRYGC